MYVVFCFIAFGVNTSAIDCLERLVSKMTYTCVDWDVKPYTVTHSCSYKKRLVNIEKLNQ